MFVKGEHERQFAYEAHTACDKRGFVLGVEVTAGNVHDSVAWDKVYDNVTSKFDVQFVAMDAGYKTPWIAKKTLDDGKIPVLPYTRYKGSKEGYRPWDYKYNPVKDVFTCPTVRSFAIPQQTEMKKESTAALPKTVSTVHPNPTVKQTGKGKRYSQRTSGRNTWILWKTSERPTWASKFTPSEKKPLSGSLRTQKRNTQCVIHTTEAWPQLPDGSGLNLLP